MWWTQLNQLQQITFIIASVATALMIILIIMMLIGMEGSDSFDGDIGPDMDAGDLDDAGDAFNHESFFSIGGLKIVTLRGALAFFSIGGWVVYLLAESMESWLAILIGFVAGAVAAVLLAIIMKAIFSLESAGNLDYTTAIGKTATVYIRIPKNGNGKGKIMFTHQGRLVEVDAITKYDGDIIAKHEVTIVGLENETTLIVKPLEDPEL